MSGLVKALQRSLEKAPNLDFSKNFFLEEVELAILGNARSHFFVPKKFFRKAGQGAHHEPFRHASSFKKF